MNTAEINSSDLALSGKSKNILRALRANISHAQVPVLPERHIRTIGSLELSKRIKQ